ncbi:MAG: zinc ABC transporter substrate-binding protein [Lachnospiraceae bacterium]|nr:zinc ABC transporter substrate-binding protein [Lachnospiraceae bacterium]
MKKVIKYINLIAMMILFVCLTGCKNVSKEDDGKIKIVCTAFPQYDWVREIAGDNIDNIELILLGDGADLHSYQPSTGDIVTISDCDIFIYVGGVSDGWVDDVLKQATNDDMIVINMMEILSDKLHEEELVEGMEDGEHHHEDEEHHHEDEEQNHDNVYEDLVEYDEHVWLSLKNAIIICEEICDALISVDGGNENRVTYETNCGTYVMELQMLDEEYSETVSSAKFDTILFGDRFPFVYMVEDYGLNYYAAFVGCSSESEASIETIAFLAGKMDELELPAVLVVEGSTTDLAKTVVESTKAKDYPILVMDSLQTVTKADMDGGKNYLDTMKSNLEILKQALLCE